MRRHWWIAITAISRGSAYLPLRTTTKLIDSFNIIRREIFVPILDHVYHDFGMISNSTNALDAQERSSVRAEQLALVYIILAMGSYYSLEVTPDDSSVEEYLTLSRACLSKADFMANNTIAGIQTLVSLHYCENVPLE
jgi:hypothetical protein